MLDTIKEVLTNPSGFFKKDTGIKSAFKFHLILSLISTILVSLGMIVIRTIRWDPSVVVLGTVLLFAPILMYLTWAVSTFVIAALFHLWLMLFGAKSYSKTYQILIYSTTPTYLLGWIPMISFFAAIYSMVLAIIGIKEMHNFSTGKAVLAYFLPVALLVVLMVFGMIAAAIAIPTLLTQL